MGRTVPSFRIAIAEEIVEWRSFRNALPKGERIIFDEMVNTAKLYASASSATVRPLRIEGFMMAVIFHHAKELLELAEGLCLIEEKIGENGKNELR